MMSRLSKGLWFVVFCAGLGVGNSVAGRTIKIDRFSLSPTRIEPGESFELAVKASARGVDMVSFVVRTSKPAAEKNAPPGFTYYSKSRQLAYVPEKGQVYLTDNGPHDLDPADRAFRMRVSTKDWPPGRYDLSIHATNRPGRGSFVRAQRHFAVLVEKDHVRLVDMGVPSPTKFQQCELTPAVVDPGGTVALDITAETPAAGVEVRVPYNVAEENVPSGFAHGGPNNPIAYMADKDHKLVLDNGTLDRNPEKNKIGLRFDTTGWKPGLYFLQLTLRSGQSVDGQTDVRNVAFKVRSPGDRLNVTVSKSRLLCPGTHANRMTRLSDGTVLHTNYFSTDSGQTWQQRDKGTVGNGCVELRNGQVLGMPWSHYPPIKGRKGWHHGQRYVSLDLGRTVQTHGVEFHVPKAKGAHGHGAHVGPLFNGSIIERADGSLVALMCGWFVGDDTICPYSPRRPYSRTYTCLSEDGGKTWRYLSTVGYDFIGSEGYNEGSMKALPNGDLLAVMRTGSMKDKRCHDNPIMLSRSSDGGKTWAKPRRTGVNGACPDLLVLSDGTLAISYGRPGAAIMFSADEGRTWTDHTAVDTTPYSGYTSMVQIAPGEILMAFGTRDYIDPETGKRDNAIRVATVCYQGKK